MITNNSKFQIRRGLEKIARLRATGMAFAVLLTVFAGNLSAQMRGHEGYRRAPIRQTRIVSHGYVRHHARFIPDHRFRTYFGRHHSFYIGRPVFVAGVPRFQYGGFSFAIIDPWPPVWRYTSAMYIENIDGQYYLCNPLDPSVRIAIEVLG